MILTALIVSILSLVISGISLYISISNKKEIENIEWDEE